jgi:hypothetical protein
MESLLQRAWRHVFCLSSSPTPGREACRPMVAAPCRMTRATRTMLGVAGAVETIVQSTRSKRDHRQRNGVYDASQCEILISELFESEIEACRSSRLQQYNTCSLVGGSCHCQSDIANAFRLTPPLCPAPFSPSLHSYSLISKRTSALTQRYH